MSFIISEPFALLGFYAVSAGSWLPTFWDNLSVPYSRKKPLFLDFWPLKIVPISSPETSVTNYRYTLRNIPEDRRPQLHSGRSLNFCMYSTSSPNIVTGIKLVNMRPGHVERPRHANSCQIFVGKYEGKRPPGGPKLRQVNINRDIKQTECDAGEWIQLAQDKI
jgi:hypothetical protein